MKWAEKNYQECLFESEQGERARVYVGQRKLNGPTVRSFGLGYAYCRGRLAGADCQRGPARPFHCCTKLG